MSESRELFPVTFVGQRTDRAIISGTRNPDGTTAGKLSEHFADVPEPTEEELKALESGEDPPALVQPEAAEPEAAGKAKGAPAKG